MKIKRDQIKKRQETSNKEISKNAVDFMKKSIVVTTLRDHQGPLGLHGTTL
jgi:hypothetical protein